MSPIPSFCCEKESQLSLVTGFLYLEYNHHSWSPPSAPSVDLIQFSTDDQASSSTYVSPGLVWGLSSGVGRSSPRLDMGFLTIACESFTVL